MGGALFLLVTGGIIGTGVLFHAGHPVAAVCVAGSAYAGCRWVWRFWLD